MKKNAIGTHRQTLRSNTQPAVRLELHGQTWELDDAEQGAIAVFLTEMRRTRYWKHETWCDPQVHELNADGGELDETPCVSRTIQVSDELGGWWHQDEPGTEPRFYIDRDIRFGPSWDGAVDDVQALLSFTTAGSAVHDLLTIALAELGNAGGLS